MAADNGALLHGTQREVERCGGAHIRGGRGAGGEFAGIGREGGVLGKGTVRTQAVSGREWGRAGLSKRRRAGGTAEGGGQGGEEGAAGGVGDGAGGDGGVCGGIRAARGGRGGGTVANEDAAAGESVRGVPGGGEV
eukprot:GFKZ01013600.1.p4 GENE.GFKZ01013600.1~~GFKZ01013600.1.p4  ORF type:complete len:136 (-),score=19.98 GFKZ01013600.1:303-710(-)